ncbi:hypothetical protein SRB5_17820 [Streptomyces sp. RB5]|uniref:Beta-ketoacyl-[acyl-carrier-protein] synthase III N-terminal domain-containing protein n=1 Tax=Streptomyces smaragdinus TaxID=2585196 RepID=A0A7K0CEA1_9ACTN|nr:3-oxoacyl-ACP synthase III family protein [Streptomyces smaragdinus]MQY11663.1 hypothetical protein [Streptomyces smaragdinus]
MRAPGALTAHLAGIGTALPGPPVDNAALSARLGVSAAWIDHFIGTRTRHFCRDLDGGRIRMRLADLCARAAERALADAGVTADELTFLVLATATPDALMPTTAAEVADRLGADRIPAYQIQSGCSGAVQALTLATALLAAAPAAGRRPLGLVVGGDVCTKHLDVDRDFTALPPGELVNYVLFGDGAGAAVLGRGGPGRAVLTAAWHRFEGLAREPGQRLEWFGAADRDDGTPAVAEDYKAVQERVPELARAALEETLTTLGWDRGDLDYLLPPQLGGRMTARITEELTQGLGCAAVNCVADTGNNGNALVLLQLEQLLDRLGAGERAVGVAVESSKWITSGFALVGSDERGR